ncbi:MAG TPA: oligopeptide transporter, OPT family [Cyanobacteria bacterium UBA8530]|nr:oligopeptide transporter, OPT family [Cyanobacteria bacterium UBA8530]
MTGELVAGKDYVPYVPAERRVPELTPTAILIGSILAILFGAANAYLGLKVGLTVSASIPASVISMGIIRGLLKRNSILENNIVQAIASSGEALAAGVIFTIPALIIWGLPPKILTVILLSILGGLLGVLMMIPIRQYLIVQEHGKLPFPEGTACAEVLVAGEVGGQGAKSVFTALALGGLYKIFSDGFKFWPSAFEGAVTSMKTGFGIEFAPSLMGVGFIIGPRIAAFMLAGGVLGWFGLIPLISYLGAHITTPVYPSLVPLNQMDYSGIWSSYIRYIGAGAVAFGGVVSLVKSFPTMVSSFKIAFAGIKEGIGLKDIKRTEADIPMPWILGGTVLIILAIAFLPQIPVQFGPMRIVVALCAAIFGFFFVTVSSRIVGIIGASSNPASGMTIATLLATAILFKAMGWSGQSGQIAAIAVGAIVCIAIAMAGDTSQDLKTGFLVGATPWKQQIALIIGVLASSLVIGSVVLVLHKATPLGSAALPAPQATMMALVVKGVMNGTLPWALVLVGCFASLTVELLGINSLAFAVGLYLPLGLSTSVMVGGLVRWVIEQRLEASKKKGLSSAIAKSKVDNGVLIASGLIAGDALFGVVLALWDQFNQSTLHIPFPIPAFPLGSNGIYLSLLMYAALILFMFRGSFGGKEQVPALEE